MTSYIKYIDSNYFAHVVFGYFVFMNHALYEVLIEYGFSKTEAIIYLTLLEIGRWSIESMYRITSIDIETITAAIHTMFSKEYLLCLPKDWIKQYIAVTPQELIARKKEACEKLQHILQSADGHIALHIDNIQHEPLHTNQKNIIEYYEGVSWLKDYYNHQIIEGKESLSFFSPTRVHPILLEFLQNEHVPKRIAHDVSVKVITDNEQNKQKEIYTARDEASQRETKKIRSPFFKIGAWINLFWNHTVWIAMYSHFDMSAMIIKSKKLYTSLRSLFLVMRNIQDNN